MKTHIHVQYDSLGGSHGLINNYLPLYNFVLNPRERERERETLGVGVHEGILHHELICESKMGLLSRALGQMLLCPNGGGPIH